MYYLTIFKNDKQVRRLSVKLGCAISIGRHIFNDIYLKDDAYKVSRFHAALFSDLNGNFFIQDLGSRNNTYVNGKKYDYGPLIENDKIQIGDYELSVTSKTTSNKKDDGNFQFIDEDSQEIKTVYSPLPVQTNYYKNIKNNPDGLLFLYQINKLQSSSADIYESLSLIVNKLYNWLKPKRIFIGQIENMGERIECLARAAIDDVEFKISKTLIKYIIKEKKIVVTDDALTDIRFRKYNKTAKSIKEIGLGSAICVPLMWSGEVKGFLFIEYAKSIDQKYQKELDILSIIGEDISAFLEKSCNYKFLQTKTQELENRIELENIFFIGICDKIKTIIKAVDKLSRTDASVLITGETGTGKDLIAEMIHQNSNRKDKPFLNVNCAAIPHSIMESELFGVIANYPGFHNKEPLTGKFYLANSGTIFLNEIGELPLELQAKLLEVLEKKIIWPIGNTSAVPIDVRIIAATNQDLKKRISEGKFREDLYERLNIFPIHLPSLRERQEDIPLLAGYFIYRFRQKYGKRIDRLSNASVELISSYPWPRNIRELKNSIERAIIMTESPVLNASLFNFTDEEITGLKSLEDVEKEHIIKILEYVDGNKEKASKILGITKQTLYNRGKYFELPGFN